MKRSEYDVVVIGAGQAGLALGYYLRRTSLDWVILDNQEQPGGAWTRTWDSLRLFSPARWSSLPGRLMDGREDEYPSRDDALAYLAWYEDHYALPVRRPVHVNGVTRLHPHAEETEPPDTDARFRYRLETTEGPVLARALISATGTWSHPVQPTPPGYERFKGEQLHSAHYDNQSRFANKRVAIVGGGNSAAQILAELSKVADTLWCTLEAPTYLPDDVDGRYLFDQATIRYRAQKEGRTPPPPASLGDIVMVPSVKDARSRGVLVHTPMFDAMTETGLRWSDGREVAVDAVIWATGYRAALSHLAGLDLFDSQGRIPTDGTRATRDARLWLVGYGGWTGYASATIIGVGRTARATVAEVDGALTTPPTSP